VVIVSRTMRHHLAVLALLACAAPAALRAQSLPVGDPLEDYVRVLSDAGRAGPGSFVIRPLGLDSALASVGADSTHPWRERVRLRSLARYGSLTAGLADPEMHLFENTAYPWGTDDGAVWAGKGATIEWTAGGFVRWGPLTLQLRPSLIWDQNAAFPLAAVNKSRRSIYGNPWHPQPGLANSIDLPQRFGPDPFWTLDAGQSSIRADWHWASAGFGTENLWWGPGIRNAILMSNNAPGFPHAFVATNRPVDIGFARFEAQWIWGRLQQSKYFDTTDTLTRRFVTGAVFDIQPKALPGLYLGATRLFYENIPDGGLGTKEYFLVFEGMFKANLATPSDPSGNDRRDQILSVFARWALPAGGFEAYVEWARNDHSWNLRDFLMEPEHSQGYTVGFQKVNALGGGRLLRINGELTHLEKDLTQVLRATPSFYAHTRVLQGFTQDGQVVGAGVGPGGDEQYLGADLFARWGRAGIFLQRVVNDNDAAYVWSLAHACDFYCHDVSLTLGGSALVFRGSFDLGASLAYTKELNRDLQQGNDVRNLNLRMTARWHVP